MDHSLLVSPSSRRKLAGRGEVQFWENQEIHDGRSLEYDVIATLREVITLIYLVLKYLSFNDNLAMF